MKGLRINRELCIGCRACSFACVEGLIVVRDDNDSRALFFPGKCPEDRCTACIELCPTGALEATDTPVDEGVEHRFLLVGCKACGSRFATLDMINHVKNALGHLETHEAGWIFLCRNCRREIPPVT